MVDGGGDGSAIGRGVSGGSGTAANLVTRAASPPPLYIARRQGPTNQIEVVRPDQGAVKGSIEPLGSTVWRST